MGEVESYNKTSGLHQKPPARYPHMAATNLLATNTVNLKTILANGRIYHVPPYQRNYSWKEENWEDLWLDLIELEHSASQHYMGAIVLKGDDHPEHFLIIDGQQRLATLSILVLVVIARLEDLADREIG